MCVVSMVMDHYHYKWYPQLAQTVYPYSPPTIPFNLLPAISQAEVDEFHRLLDRAREYDKRMGEPDCEMEEKRQALRAIAEKLGIDISFIDKADTA